MPSFSKLVMAGHDRIRSVRSSRHFIRKVLNILRTKEANQVETVRQIRIVESRLESSVPGLLTSFRLTQPTPGQIIAGLDLPIAGHALGTEKAAYKLTVSWDPGRAIASLIGRSYTIQDSTLKSTVVSWKGGKVGVPIRLARPHLVKRYNKNHPWVARAGFRTDLALWRAAGLVDLNFSVHIGDQAIPVGTITCEVEVNRPAIQPRLSPIMITALGRSGTTLCMHALAHHPEIVVAQEYPHEIRTAQHLINNLHRSLDVGSVHLGPPAAASYLAQDFAHNTVEYYMNCIDQFYTIVAQVNKQPHARYFAEKFSPLRSQGWFYDLYPQAKEIILVRDFRDVLCSILAFNAKRGTLSWGRDRCESDVEFVSLFNESVNSLRTVKRINGNRALLVRYEDLIMQPQETLTSLFTYLEVDKSPSLIKKICDLCAQPIGKFKTHMTSNTAENSIGRWQRDLPSEVKAVAQEILGDALDEFEYESG